MVQNKHLVGKIFWKGINFPETIQIKFNMIGTFHILFTPRPQRRLTLESSLFESGMKDLSPL